MRSRFHALLPLLTKLRPSAPTALYIALALFATAPAWIVKYPPMMDIPFHLSTIRVIHSIHDRAFGFDEDFVLTLGRTQYVVYYIVGSVLSYVLGVVKANIVLVSLYLGGTVLSLRALLQALGKDERLCIFVVPLLVNMMFMYGLFPFLVGIPLMFVALAVAVRHFEKPTLARGIWLAVLTLALFYSHIFPFAIFGLGFAAMFPWTQPHKWLRSAAPPIPALLVLVWWTTSTAAGKLVLGALLDSKDDPRQPLDASIGDVHNWFSNIFKDTSDEKVLIALLVIALLATGFAQGERDRAKPVARAYVLLPIACVFFYFTSTQGHGYIWLIQQRFPMLFAMTGIPLLRMPSGWRGALATTGAVALAAMSTVNVCKHFIEFQLDEVGDIDGAIATMEPKKHVMALIYDRGTNIMHPSLQPFLHYGAYYQLQKGGVVMFTYAGYAHWPYAFKPGHYTPQGEAARHRWEWMPDQVPMTEIFPYYDYVLTRGNGFHPPTGTYHVKWRSDRWTVWQRD